MLGELQKAGLADLDAIESALNGYTAKRLPPVESCLHSVSSGKVIREIE